MLLVPGAIIAMIGAHLYLVVKLGTTAPPWLRAEQAEGRRARVAQLDAGAEGDGSARSELVKPREKQAYLEEYEVLKKKGKPFFPYAIMKDSAMAVIVVVVIIVMSIFLGAEQGPKADPTTTTYVPRPEWYFFFLFELLRVIKPPELVPIATIGMPTICMVLLLLLPFYDRSPERNPAERPIATTAGCLTIVSMAYLTFLGANAGSPTEIDMKVAPAYEAGKEVVAGSGCLACHKLGENGNNGPGPEADPHRASAIPRAAIVRSVEIGPGIMPSFRDLPPKKLDELAEFLSSLDSGVCQDSCTRLTAADAARCSVLSRPNSAAIRSPCVLAPLGPALASHAHES